MPLSGKTILITGAALRIGRSVALAIAQAGGEVILHYGKSREAAESLQVEIETRSFMSMGAGTWYGTRYASPKWRRPTLPDKWMRPGRNYRNMV